MDKSRHITRICFCLVVMAVISAPQGVISLPCNVDTNGQTVDGVGTRPTEGERSGSRMAAPAVAIPTPSAIKKDLFMSRGWGASGMPFSMFYLNHYTKAQKAYAQSQLHQQQLQQQQQQLQQQQLQQQQQQQHQQLQQQTQQHQQDLLRIQHHREQEEEPLQDRSQDEPSKSMSERPLLPKSVPFDPQYEAEPISVHAQQLRTDTDYLDSSPSVRTTSKMNTVRRQYTVPQLFVSYGWGPMG